ncbi:MAG: hypothetical protein IJ560_00610 [Alphaproteobacteria bacterium]|nr:hypothetical protein [Alphaproteobacteria bacterium]
MSVLDMTLAEAEALEKSFSDDPESDRIMLWQLRTITANLRNAIRIRNALRRLGNRVRGRMR